MPQGETLKTTGRWHKKVGVQNKAGINLKIPPQPARMSRKTPLYV
jgi:hypothetical protein